MGRSISRVKSVDQGCKWRDAALPGRDKEKETKDTNSNDIKPLHDLQRLKIPKLGTSNNPHQLNQEHQQVNKKEKDFSFPSLIAQTAAFAAGLGTMIIGSLNMVPKNWMPTGSMREAFIPGIIVIGSVICMGIAQAWLNSVLPKRFRA